MPLATEPSFYDKTIGHYKDQGETLSDVFSFDEIATMAFTDTFLGEDLGTPRLNALVSREDRIAYFFGWNIIEKNSEYQLTWDWTFLFRFLFINLPRLALFIPRLLDLALHSTYLTLSDEAEGFFESASGATNWGWKFLLGVSGIIFKLFEATAFALHIASKIAFWTLSLGITPLAAFLKAKKISPVLGAISIILSIGLAAGAAFLTAGGSVVGQSLTYIGNIATASKISTFWTFAVGCGMLGTAVTAGRTLFQFLGKKVLNCFSKKSELQMPLLTASDTINASAPLARTTTKQRVSTTPPQNQTGTIVTDGQTENGASFAQKKQQSHRTAHLINGGRNNTRSPTLVGEATNDRQVVRRASFS
jgi:hypothetical protein